MTSKRQAGILGYLGSVAKRTNASTNLAMYIVERSAYTRFSHLQQPCSYLAEFDRGLQTSNSRVVLGEDIRKYSIVALEQTLAGLAMHI